MNWKTHGGQDNIAVVVARFEQNKTDEAEESVEVGQSTSDFVPQSAGSVETVPVPDEKALNITARKK